MRRVFLRETYPLRLTGTGFMGQNQSDARRSADPLHADLKRCGVKLTHQRMVIYQEIAKSREHPDAESICKAVRKKLPMVSLDTVYRTLWLLQDLGLIHALRSRDRVRFDGNKSAHHHFVCRKCGQLLDFYSPEYDRLEIPESLSAIGIVENAQVEVRGICRSCAAKVDSRRRPAGIKEKRSRMPGSSNAGK